MTCPSFDIWHVLHVFYLIISELLVLLFVYALIDCNLTITSDESRRMDVSVNMNTEKQILHECGLWNRKSRQQNWEHLWFNFNFQNFSWMSHDQYFSQRWAWGLWLPAFTAQIEWIRGTDASDCKASPRWKECREIKNQKAINGNWAIIRKVGTRQNTANQRWGSCSHEMTLSSFTIWL